MRDQPLQGSGPADTLRCIEVMGDVAVYVSHDDKHGITALSLARDAAFVGSEMTDAQREAVIAALAREPVVPRSVADALADAVEKALSGFGGYQGQARETLAAYRAGGNTNEETG